MNLLTPDPPEDMVEFWAEAVDQALSARLDFRRSAQSDQRSDNHKIELIDFRGIDGEARHGWIATPKEGNSHRGFLWIPPYSRWSMLPNEYGTREGMTSLSFNFFGEPAFHQETYTPRRGYFSEGAKDPQSFIFRRMFQDAVLATRVLQAQAECDENRVGAMGMSQGGGIAIWLGAWLPSLVKAVCADMPFLGGMPWVLSQSVHRYPLKELTDFMDSIPLGRQIILHTLSYFDTLNQAVFCQVPVHLSLGLKDPAVRPIQVQSIFESLRGEKALVELEWGHDWHPSMIEANAAWLVQHLG